MSVAKVQQLSGAHDAATHATIMTDSGESLTVDALIGLYLDNVTDGSSGLITDNCGTTITVDDLVGGAGNNWESGDVWKIRYFNYRSLVSKIFVPSLAAIMTVQAAKEYGKLIVADLDEIPATINTGTTDTDEISWYSKKEGDLGNGDAITLVDPGEDATLAITANDGTEVTIRLAYAEGAITTTVAELVSFVNGAGIHLRASSSETGTNLVAADSKSTLASGAKREMRCQFTLAADRLSAKSYLYM